LEENRGAPKQHVAGKLAFVKSARYFSATSGNSMNSHLLASVIHASRMRAALGASGIESDLL